MYKGVLPEYVPLIEHMTGGPSIALEVRQENAVSSFRALVGPHDPEIAKHLRPNTIRYKFYSLNLSELSSAWTESETQCTALICQRTVNSNANISSTSSKIDNTYIV